MSLGAFAAKPGLSFDATGAIVTVPAGHSVTWLLTGSSSYETGIAADSDSDGVVRIAKSSPQSSRWIVADVQTGEWQTSGVYESSIDGWEVEPDPQGNRTIIELGDQFGGSGGGLWIRPGVGVWAPSSPGWDEPLRLATSRRFILVDISQMSPIGSSPATPAGAVNGDVLLTLGGGYAWTGLVVEPTPYAGRLYFENWSSSHVEGRTITVDVIRSLGTAGTITTSCQPSFTTVEAPPGDKAQPGIDYVAFGVQPLTFGPGEVVKQCTFTLLDDGAYTDLPRDFFVELTPATGGALVDYYGGFHTVLIEDDDPAPVLSFGSVPASVVEGDTSWTLNVPWSLTGNFRGKIAVRFFASGSSLHEVTPSANQLTSPVTIQANNVPSSTQTIELRLVPNSNSSRISPAAVHTLTIIDDDAAPPPVTMTTQPVVEGNAGTTNANVHVQLATATTLPLTMTVATTTGTAAANVDYVPFANSVTFQPGETQKDVALTIHGDVIDENNETVGVTATWEGQTLASASVTIVDDDDTSVAVIFDAAVVEKTGTSTFVDFHLTLSPPAAAAVTLQYSTEDDTAKAGSDYAAASGTLTFPAGQGELHILVEVFGDATTEQDERFSVRLTNATGAVIGGSRAFATIYDDDAGASRPTLSVDDIQVTESAGWKDATFTLRLSQASAQTVKLSFETRAGSATATADYEHRSGLLTFLPGETVHTIVVRIAGDAVAEETETFTLWLSNGDGVVISDVSATCTIRDDDKSSRRRSVRP